MDMYLDSVKLRKFTKNDILYKVKWINDEKNNEFLHYDLPLDFNRTERWFYSKDNDIRLDLLIEYKGQPAGIIGLLDIDMNHRKAEYYITIGESELKRKGVGLKASYLLLEHAFTQLNLNKVYLNVDEKNKGAIALYEKVGFKCEGVFINDMFFRGEWINRCRYAISQFEWRNLY